MTMLFLLLIPMVVVIGYRLYRANAKVDAILRDEIQDILREELPAPPRPLTVPLNVGALRPERPVAAVGTSAGRVGSP